MTKHQEAYGHYTMTEYVWSCIVTRMKKEDILKSLQTLGKTRHQATDVYRQALERFIELHQRQVAAEASEPSHSSEPRQPSLRLTSFEDSR